MGDDQQSAWGEHPIKNMGRGRGRQGQAASGDQGRHRGGYQGHPLSSSGKNGDLFTPVDEEDGKAEETFVTVTHRTQEFEISKVQSRADAHKCQDEQEGIEQTETEEFVIQAHVPKYAHQHCFFDEEELDDSDDGDADCEQRQEVIETAVASTYSQVMDT